jgi:hypothetical protein
MNHIFYKLHVTSFLHISSNIFIIRRADERRLEAAEMLFQRYVAGYTLWDKEWIDEIRSQLRTRKLDK